MVNKVILIGNIGTDIQTRFVGENKVANFSLATSERYKDKNGQVVEATEWHNIVAWRHLADILEQWCGKGDKLFVEGSLKTRSWTTPQGEKRYATDIVAREIHMLGSKRDKSGQQAPTSQPGRPAVAPKPNVQPGSQTRPSAPVDVAGMQGPAIPGMPVEEDEDLPF